MCVLVLYREPLAIMGAQLKNYRSVGVGFREVRSHPPAPVMKDDVESSVLQCVELCTGITILRDITNGCFQ